jgi:hypothetical protein
VTPATKRRPRRFEGSQGLDYPRILGGTIVAPSGVEPDPVAVTSGHQAVAVVLDFVDPCRPAGGLPGGAREAGGYEAEGQRDFHTGNEHARP